VTASGAPMLKRRDVPLRYMWTRNEPPPSNNIHVAQVTEKYLKEEEGRSEREFHGR